MPFVLSVNITGPDGVARKAGDPVPAAWGKAYIDSLVRSGGAKTAPAKTAKTAKTTKKASK